jgi:hypothetical protein
VPLDLNFRCGIIRHPGGDLLHLLFLLAGKVIIVESKLDPEARKIKGRRLFFRLGLYEGSFLELYFVFFLGLFLDVFFRDLDRSRICGLASFLLGFPSLFSYPRFGLFFVPFYNWSR